MRGVGAFLSAVCGLWLFSQPALAEKRVALVIGNSAYEHVSQLVNPSNDSEAISAMLKQAGFDIVDFRRDLRVNEMRRALRDFSDQSRDADIAVVYYAGHGIEIDGTNYMIPVDAVLRRDFDAYDEAISLDRLLTVIDPARQLRLVILDACRDNPFSKTMKRTVSTRSVGRGLALVEPTAANTLIAFAAKAGSTASDGDGGNSPFTTALVKHLPRPGLDLRRAFGFARDDVLKATNNRQEPFVYGSLGGNDVALVPATKPAAPAATAPADSEVAVRRAYELALQVATVEIWDSFVSNYPNSFYTDLAKAQRRKLIAEEARLAAIEKAKTAVEDKNRQAIEEARAIEQAKALELAKAAEQARLAAEKKRTLEEAKAAEAERAKAAAQAKAEGEARLAAEKAARAKAVEEAKAAQQARLAVEQKAREDARVAETERAKAAAQAKTAEETRLAAAKAKAEEEAKTAQQARLAAEQKAREDAKAAEAERAKAAAKAKAEAEARIAAENAAAAAQQARIAAEQKVLEDARIAARAKAEGDAKTAAAKPAPEDKAIGPLAALTPPEQASQNTSKENSPAEIPRLLQTELRRVGCNAGAIDGNWDAAAQKSLALFNRNAGTKLDVKTASLDALDIVRSKPARICPLICDRGYKADGDTCTKITCRPGYELGDDNSCARVRTKKPVVREAPASAPATSARPSPDRPAAAEKPAQGPRTAASVEALYAKCARSGVGGRGRTGRFNAINACVMNGGKL
jgi:uncharacterized caspase-like protein